MQVRREKGTLENSEENYIEKLLEMFWNEEYQKTFTPIAGKQQINRSDCPYEGSQKQKEIVVFVE